MMLHYDLYIWIIQTGVHLRIELFMYSLVPLISTMILTLVLLAPLVPVYVIILFVILIIYVIVVWQISREAAYALMNRTFRKYPRSLSAGRPEHFKNSDYKRK